MGVKEIVLTVSIVVALLAGALVGQFVLHGPVVKTFDAEIAALIESGGGSDGSGNATESLRELRSARAEALSDRTGGYTRLGDLMFVRPLKMLVVPIVFVGVLVGVAGIGRADRLGALGGATIAYYLVTMAASITVGLVLAAVFSPGAGASSADLDQQARAAYEDAGISSRVEDRPESFADIAFQLAESVVPTNPVAAAAEGDTLPLVTLGILLGLAIVVIGASGKPAYDFFNSLFDALIRLVMWVIWLAIPGVFLIVAGRVGLVGFEAFAGTLAKFALVVVAGLLVHSLVTLPAVAAVLTRANPFRFMWQMRKALLTAFGTSSSAATLPVTIRESVESGGCSERAANFVLPVGATVNMDGTALYIAVVTSFLFEVYGFDLNLAQYAIILFTATLAAVGTAAVPSASLVLMAIVITAVNNTVAVEPGREGLPLHAIGIILGVDRLLDMCRTTVNVWGDAVGAKILTRLAPDEGEPAPGT